MTDKIKCPECGEEIAREYYMEDYWLVEQHAECSCGWQISWAYGQDLLVEPCQDEHEAERGL